MSIRHKQLKNKPITSTKRTKIKVKIIHSPSVMLVDKINR